MATRKIRIYCQEKTTGDGRKFTAYHTATKNGVKMTVKLRQNVNPKPTKDCFILVDDNDVNEQKNSVYPVLWVSAIKEILPLEFSADNTARMNELFGEPEA